jgi:hypothetical protein
MIYFFKIDCQSNAKPSEKDLTYPGFEPGTCGLAVSIAIHYTNKPDFWTPQNWPALSPEDRF